MLLIRNAEPDEASTLTAIALAAKASWGYPPRWLDQWRQELTIDATDVNRLVIRVAEQNGSIVGFFGLATEEDVWTLEHLWVHPEAMRCGIGRRLFEAAAAHVRAEGGTHVDIVSDPNAEGFYIRLGATRVGVRDGSLDGVERSLPVMRFGV